MQQREQLAREPPDHRLRDDQRAVEDRVGPGDTIAGEHHSHRLHVHHFQNVIARLLEEVRSPAVHPHAAADLVDQAQFFVSGGELLGKIVELLAHARQSQLVAEHRGELHGLACDGLTAVAGQRIGVARARSRRWPLLCRRGERFPPPRRFRLWRPGRSRR